MKRKIRYSDDGFIGKDSRTSLHLFPIYRNLQDIVIGLIQISGGSHCIMSFEKYGSKNKKPY